MAQKTERDMPGVPLCPQGDITERRTQRDVTDVRYQWIAQRQVDPVSLYCDRVGAMSSHGLRDGVPVWQDNGPSITATIRIRRDMTSDVKVTLNHNKQKHEMNMKASLDVTVIHLGCPEHGISW